MHTCAVRLLLFVLTIAAAAPVTAAECSADAGTPRLRLVELYTSEGCSSCPPADDWLRRLPHAAAALGFHVDYWDGLGWRDRFADPRYARRQEEQARREHGSGIYTPQVVIDGRTSPGWYRSAAPATAAAAAAASTRIVASGTGVLRIAVDSVFPSGADAADFRTFIAATEDGLSSQVRAGENRGAMLRHDHVVRAFAGPLPLHAQTELRLPADADIARTTLVAFVQRSDGAVAQVLACPLHDG